MTDKPENPQAYPVYSQDMNLGDTAGPGMTLRDYFAIHYDISNRNIDSEFHLSRGCPPSSTERSELMAKIRYQEADAMLTERAKK